MVWGGGDSLDREESKRHHERLLWGGVMSNYDALLTLIGDINNAFCHLEEEDVADICDGDIKLLDKAVKRFKTTVWENQL